MIGPWIARALNAALIRHQRRPLLCGLQWRRCVDGGPGPRCGILGGRGLVHPLPDWERRRSGTHRRYGDVVKVLIAQGWHQRPDFPTRGYLLIQRLIQATSSSQKRPFALQYQLTASDPGTRGVATQSADKVTVTQLHVVRPGATLLVARSDGADGKWRMIATAIQRPAFFDRFELGASPTQLFHLNYVDPR